MNFASTFVDGIAANTFHLIRKLPESFHKCQNTWMTRTIPFIIVIVCFLGKAKGALRDCMCLWNAYGEFNKPFIKAVFMLMFIIKISWHLQRGQTWPRKVVWLSWGFAGYFNRARVIKWSDVISHHESDTFVWSDGDSFQWY